MINVDFNCLSSYRSDGRKRLQLRSTDIQLGIDAHADGSCRLKQGLTQVLCLVHGPYQRPSYSDFLIKIQYTVAPFSSLEKRKGNYDRDFSDFSENIRKSFQGIIIGQAYKKSQIEIIVSVIQNEGSAKSAVFNCISLALINAGISMKDLIVSCTVGTINGNIIIDLNQQEQYDLSNELIVSYLKGSEKLDCVSLKKAKLKQDDLQKIQREVIVTCRELYGRIRKALIIYSMKKMLIF